MKKIKILGVRVDNLNFNQAVRRIDSFIKSRQPHQVVTVNPEFVMTALKNREFFKILNSADLAVADGKGLIWASEFLYGSQSALKEKVAGIDLVWALAKLASEKSYSIYFLGGQLGVAEKTAMVLKKIHPDLKIAGFSVGEWTNKNQKLKIKNQKENQIVENIKDSQADILLVAYGAPKQDKFIAQNLDKLGVKVAMGVGGSFDFIAGRAKRAPKLMRTNFEWLWRLVKEPWRFKRIFTAVVRFPLKIFLDKIKHLILK